MISFIIADLDAESVTHCNEAKINCNPFYCGSTQITCISTYLW